MPDLRPTVSPEQVLTVLHRHFTTPVTDLSPVEGGQIARTFSFCTGGQEYIVRFNLDRMLNSNFPKEAYLARRLASTSLPCAPIVEVGRFEDLHFAITRKMPGRMLGTMPPHEARALVLDVLALLDTMHSVDISDTQGYGVFGDQGQGHFANWADHLLAVTQEEVEEDYFGKWYRLFDETFLERDLYESLSRRMQDLLARCPEERSLLFGGLNAHNVLVENGQITAVLDLLEARYGDPVYDIVVLDFWWPWLGIREAFFNYYQERRRELPFYAERLLCYACHYALGGLRFFAQSGSERSYRVVRTIIQQKLDAFAG